MPGKIRASIPHPSTNFDFVINAEVRGAWTTGAIILSGRDHERPHHVVVLVLDDVAVVDIGLRRRHTGR